MDNPEGWGALFKSMMKTATTSHPWGVWFVLLAFFFLLSRDKPSDILAGLGAAMTGGADLAKAILWGWRR